MTDFNGPTDIRQQDRVALTVTPSTADDSICIQPLAFTVLIDGAPTIAHGYYDPDTDDNAAFTTQPITAGRYELSIQGSYGTGGSYGSNCTGTAPYAATVPLFLIPTTRPVRASTAAVEITNTGRHFVVASSRYRTPAYAITYNVKDRQHRAATYSVCLFNDDDGYSRGDDITDAASSDDCYGGPWPLARTSAITRTSSGWTLSWGQWWNRLSPSTCASWYWNEPQGSIQMLVANADGIIIGTRRHMITLSCRL
jgi:hypothetical protein